MGLPDSFSRTSIASTGNGVTIRQSRPPLARDALFAIGVQQVSQAPPDNGVISPSDTVLAAAAAARRTNPPSARR